MWLALRRAGCCVVAFGGYVNCACDMEDVICSQYGEILHILNTENITICLHFIPYLQQISYDFQQCKNFENL